MEKSYVSMGQKICEVCGRQYSDGTILLDRRLRNSMNRETVTGFGMCDEHRKLKEDGFVALIGIDESASVIDTANNMVKQENAERTGSIAHLRKPAFEQVFNAPAPEGMVAFVPQGVIDMLYQMQQQHQESDSGD